MNKRALISSAAISVFSTLLAYFMLGDPGIQAQAQSVGRVVKKTASVTESGDGHSRFSKAALQNAKLRNSLQWVFGGKTQGGWNIYAPLISHTIGTEGGSDSTEFAQALSKWQEKSGLIGTGVLDRETLESFTKYWQSRRLGRAGLSTEDSLTGAPIGEFYDPTRSPGLLQLEQETHAAYKRMVAAAAKDLRRQLKITGSGELAPNEKFLRIISAYRSPAYQEALRKKEPNAGRAAFAKNSPHSTGHALDIYVGGEPVKTEDNNRLMQVQTPAYKWLVKNAERFGFYPYFYEPWHWEYVPKK
jgi:zinc D-Ala-D-Ala carboxypeptidase